MQCPHCTVTVHLHWYKNTLFKSSQNASRYACLVSVCPSCNEQIVIIAERDVGDSVSNQKQIVPQSNARKAVSADVPSVLRDDYRQACTVLSLSPKASAALSRRCLQYMLNDKGYLGKDLSKQIQLLLDENDSSKSIPESLRVTVDGIRNFGNFSAHPLTDVTTLQIVDVDPEEAEWCLEIIEECFEHFYVRPAAAKARKEALNLKLLAAGKPPSK